VHRVGYGVVWLIQEGECCHCGKQLGPYPWQDEPELRDGWTREHVLPRSRGGRLPGNVLLAHASCNRRRGNKKPTETLVEVARLVWALWHRAMESGKIVSWSGRGA
jgi:5-methylcytosine-specific restriction endonuclease McrA